jgi:CDP-glucose 4,6-dehydratase
MVFADTYRGKSILVTGHTGFKGAWLCEWLLNLGANVTGFALPPPTNPSLFEQLSLAPRIRHVTGDVRDLRALSQTIEGCQPDFIFHLAAQSLVRLSYQQPAETYATNVMGTVNLLEAVRTSGRRCVVIIVTTDKCYENKEWLHSYREDDPMGGHDPYSSSKGAAELVISAYRRSFFSAPDSVVRVASTRAGNVIGGGDWAMDRIVPDCIRALQNGATIPVRNKIATRPWQHVLEPLSGYLWLGSCLYRSKLSSSGQHLDSGFNFGPTLRSNRTVAELVQQILLHWPGSWADLSDEKAVHEAKLLNLATDKAYHLLHWESVWSFESTIDHTIAWYRLVSSDPSRAANLTLQNIAAYINDARANQAAWAA